MSSLLEVDRLRAGYGMFSVLHGISLHVDEGEIVALVGSNGAGKTTSLRCISGLIAPTAGSIRFQGHETIGFKPSRLVASGLVCVPEGRHLFPEMTVRDTLLVGASAANAHAARADSLQRVYALFPKVSERREQLCGTLSGGEQQMVAIGRGLMALPKLLVLDEPSLGLAPTVVKQLFRAVQEIRDRGVTVLLVEQNVRTVLSIADRAYVIENGAVELSGTAQALAHDPRVVDAYFGSGSKESVG
jgi:branched-chain amino acid transport system ATP-binding protein